MKTGRVQSRSPEAVYNVLATGLLPTWILMRISLCDSVYIDEAGARPLGWSDAARSSRMLNRAFTLSQLLSPVNFMG
jgi:hypothetical protein